MTISRSCHAFGLQPHRADTFKLSPDPQLIEKVRDVVGLYTNPPEHALVHAAVFCLCGRGGRSAARMTTNAMGVLPCLRRSH
jgi:hypothetical protein